MLNRSSGILLHISSLPNNYGIGDFGPSAYQFVDFLCQSQQKFWQLLPLNPTNTFYGNSPYSSPSAFALNYLFVSLDFLLQDGLLDKKDLSDQPSFSATEVDYIAVSNYKKELLSLVYKRLKGKLSDINEYQHFCAENAFWLDDYALFLTLKEHFKGKEWNLWPKEYRNRDASSIEKINTQYIDNIELIKSTQFLLYQQWYKLRNYCNEKTIELIGDIPIYVNFDSADVWAHQEIFKLDENKKPIYVAGVPPDYFSKTGQRWGNPVYSWDKLKETKYAWWMQRIQYNLDLFDYIRIDHFRGLIDYWEIPANEKTAVNGHWSQGPCDDFFNCLKEKFPHLPIIAEDLGIITPAVSEAMTRYQFPGMKVLLFAFGGELQTHPYIPENYIDNCVVYTGTHDNNTVKGWWQYEASQHEKENLQNYLKKGISPDQVHRDLVTVALQSRAQLAIVPLQDVLGTGKETRMNTPGTLNGNWLWRFKQKVLTPKISDFLAQLTKNSNRI